MKRSGQCKEKRVIVRSWDQAAPRQARAMTGDGRIPRR
jgi:hypothetical protein